MVQTQTAANAAADWLMTMRPVKVIAAAALLTMMLTSPEVHANADRTHSHVHAAGEIDEDHGPILIELTYTADTIANVSGGIGRGTRYLDNLDLVFEADLEAVTGWRGAALHVYGLYNNGKSISALAGDAQAVSNIETGTRAIRLYEAWINQKIGQFVSLKAGLYDLNSEFDALDTAGLFVGSAHGIGTDISQTGQNGPSIFPFTSLAARLEARPAPGWAVRAAVLDGVPGNPAHPGQTAIRLGKGDGALLIGEVEAPLAGLRLLLGHWRYTGRFDRIDGGRDDGNAGIYVRGEGDLVKDGDRTLSAFFRLGTASGRFNTFDRFASGGVKFSGWVDGRAGDEFGLAIGTAFTSDAYRLQANSGKSETAIEATYRTPITQWLTLQPNIQYIANPSADPGIRDALVIGLRAEFAFRLMGD